MTSQPNILTRYYKALKKIIIIITTTTSEKIVLKTISQNNSFVILFIVEELVSHSHCAIAWDSMKSAPHAKLFAVRYTVSGEINVVRMCHLISTSWMGAYRI